jgi:hypothetical protein
MFEALCRAYGIAEPVREHVFAAPRKWRFDYAWPSQRVALEVEGGVWTGGRHISATGFLKDIEKYNAAAVRGWRVVRCTPKTLLLPATFEMLKALVVTQH